MRDLSRGQRLKLADFLNVSAPLTVTVQGQAPFGLDFACFGVDGQGRLAGDAYLLFYNHLVTPCGGVRLELLPEAARFSIDLGLLPATVERLVFTATVDGEGVMRSLRSARLEVSQGDAVQSQFSLSGADLADEKALLVAEVYRKDGVWRQAALGDGFKGGLSALLAHFGGEEQAATTPTRPAVSLNKAVRLEKELGAKAPQLVNLVKAAQVNLEKQGLVDHVAKVCLVLDVSGSMVGLYRRGVVQQIGERLLALACLFDDDQSVDVFLFDSRAIPAGDISVSTINGAVSRLVATHKLGGGTDYAPVMKLVLQSYAGSRLPVYVLFVTDGAPGDRSASQKVIREASKQGVFWQFIGVGGERFDFLEKLDDLKDRFIDNADFFAVPDPSLLDDAEMYRLMLQEYPGWLRLARQHGLVDNAP
ncbi:MAG: VWA domain-containing protein [Pseudomonadota bacterium]